MSTFGQRNTIRREPCESVRKSRAFSSVLDSLEFRDGWPVVGKTKPEDRNWKSDQKLGRKQKLDGLRGVISQRLHISQLLSCGAPDRTTGVILPLARATIEKSRPMVGFPTPASTDFMPTG